jgi:hypothetical protein
MAPAQPATPAEPPGPGSNAQLLAQLEEISRSRADRVLRLTGLLQPAAPGSGQGTSALTATAPAPATPPQPCAAAPAPPRLELAEPSIAPAESYPAAAEAFELVIYRGFSSSTTHPTAFDPDQPALPETAQISGAELLQAPLRPGAAEVLLAGPVQAFLDPAAWP